MGLVGGMRRLVWSAILVQTCFRNMQKRAQTGNLPRACSMVCLPRVAQVLHACRFCVGQVRPSACLCLGEVLQVLGWTRARCDSVAGGSGSGLDATCGASPGFVRTEKGRVLSWGNQVGATRKDVWSRRQPFWPHNIGCRCRNFEPWCLENVRKRRPCPGEGCDRCRSSQQSR